MLSALVTAALLITAFLSALVGIGHGKMIALLCAVSLALLMASLIELDFARFASIWRTCISNSQIGRFRCLAAIVWGSDLRGLYEIRSA